MRAGLRLAAALALLLPLSGCWNYSELNDRTLVAGAAVDRTESGSILLTVETADFRAASDPSAESVLLTGQGKDLAAAIQDVMDQSGRVLYWDQAALLIFGRAYAEQGIREALDYILNEHGLRLTLLLAVSRLERAADVLELEVHGAPLGSYALCDMIRGGRDTGETVYADARQVINSLLEPGVEFALPAIGSAAGPGGETADVGGCAVFRGDRMAGWLNQDDTLSLAILTGQVKQTELSVELDHGGAAVEAKNWRVSLLPREEDSRVTVHAEIRADYELLSGRAGDPGQPDGAAALNAALARALETRAASLYAHLREFSCDALGIGRRLWQRQPDRFRSISDWETVFRESDFTAQAALQCRDRITEGSILHGERG